MCSADVYVPEVWATPDNKPDDAGVEIPSPKLHWNDVIVAPPPTELLPFKVTTPSIQIWDSLGTISTFGIGNKLTVAFINTLQVEPIGVTVHE